MKSYSELIDNAVMLTVVTQAEMLPFGKRKEVETILKKINNHIEFGVWGKIQALFKTEEGQELNEQEANEKAQQLLADKVDIGEIKPVYIDPYTVKESKVDISHLVVWGKSPIISAEKALDYIEYNGFVTFENGDK